jgi:hypothetical protein
LPIPHAVDRDHRAIVDGGQFIVERRRLDLDDIGAGVRDRHGQLDLGADDDAAFLEYVAVAPDRHLRRATARALILDAETDNLRLADDAETRRLGQDDTAVDLATVPGDQRMQRRGKTERGDIGRHVVHAAVGDHDGAGNPVRRHVGKCRGQRRKQPRAVMLAVGLAGIGDPHFQAGDAFEPLHQCRLRGIRLRLAVAEFLARAAVDNDGGDRGHRVAILPR